jgi:hypothetical protein
MDDLVGGSWPETWCLEIDMLANSEHLSFCMQVVNGYSLMGACDYSETLVLDSLEFLDRCLADVWLQDGAVKLKYRAD